MAKPNARRRIQETGRRRHPLAKRGAPHSAGRLFLFAPQKTPGLPRRSRAVFAKPRIRNGALPKKANTGKTLPKIPTVPEKKLLMA